jgi:hypothetical protein
MAGLLEEAPLQAQFHIGEAIGTRPGAGGCIDGVIQWNRRPEGKNGVQLYGGNGAPVEFKGGTGGVEFHRSTVDHAKDVELVMTVVDGGGVVGLKRGAGLGMQA